MNIKQLFLICIIMNLMTVSFAYVQETDKMKAADFNLYDIDGKVHRLSKIIKEDSGSNGNIIILNFFGSWCPPCRMELPHFVKTSTEYKDKGVKFIGILLERDFNKEKIQEFIKSYKIDYLVLQGTGEVINNYGGIRGVPTTFFIDEESIIFTKHVGYMDEDTLKDLIEKMIKLREGKKKKDGTVKDGKKKDTKQKEGDSKKKENPVKK